MVDPHPDWVYSGSLLIEARAEVERLREGLRQVAEGDYPADAGNAETWAQEILDRPESGAAT